jgi:hypothetical protein
MKTRLETKVEYLKIFGLAPYYPHNNPILFLSYVVLSCL